MQQPDSGKVLTTSFNKKLLGDMKARTMGILAGGDIRRYHTAPVTKQQTIAEHSWRMASVVSMVWPDCRAELLKACLWHDVSELSTGDIPSPVKWDNPELKKELNRISTEYEHKLGIRIELTDEEADMVRWADLYEGSLFCLEQIESGNQRLVKTFRAYCGALQQLGDTTTNGPRSGRQALLRYEVYDRAAIAGVPVAQPKETK